MRLSKMLLFDGAAFLFVGEARSLFAQAHRVGSAVRKPDKPPSVNSLLNRIWVAIASKCEQRVSTDINAHQNASKRFPSDLNLATPDLLESFPDLLKCSRGAVA
jgi:hypothetical protein